MNIRGYLSGIKGNYEQLLFNRHRELLSCAPGMEKYGAQQLPAPGFYPQRTVMSLAVEMAFKKVRT